ncbi:MAG: hypothetical protein IPK82_35650 [Polyangiaceae bacterium]|nr:hypothetical protein [Polyangiaceae bacterium]
MDIDRPQTHGVALGRIDQAESLSTLLCRWKKGICDFSTIVVNGSGGCLVLVTMTLLELSVLGGPWAKRLDKRRRMWTTFPWHDLGAQASPIAKNAARVVWTRSAFSEIASAAAFAEIAAQLLAASAPIDLVAASGEFVVDEVLHAELSAHVANAFGGAVALDVDMTRLVRPPVSERPLMRAAELIVRTSCVGEALTVPVLKAAQKASRSSLIGAVTGQIVKDESAHAQIGAWFLDWADSQLSDADRVHLGNVAGRALVAFAPMLRGECTQSSDLGILDCASFDPLFARAVRKRVAAPLALRGIEIPQTDLQAIGLDVSRSNPPVELTA